MIKFLDTFAWIWWFHLALEQSIWKENIQCIGYSEIDKFAKQVYNERFPWCKDLWSITELDIDNLEDFDLLTWGFPCTDVSVAWKQNLEWWRTVLVEYLLQILEKKQPKYFVFENVKGLMSKKFNTFRESILDRIQDAWYVYTMNTLNTKDFWLPQNRERVFIVWELDIKWEKYAEDIFNFPQWQKLTTFLKDILEEEVDEKFYMTDEQYNKLSYDSIKRIYDTIAPTLDTSQWGHRQPKVLFNKFNNRIMEWISGTLGTWSWFTAKQWYMVCHNTRSREFEGTWFKKICPTLCARDYKDAKQMTDWLIIRKLTPIEYSRLQGFPDKWSTEFVSNSQAYKQMWNAISVPVVKNIFDNLLKNAI